MRIKVKPQLSPGLSGCSVSHQNLGAKPWVTQHAGSSGGSSEKGSHAWLMPNTATVFVTQGNKSYLQSQVPF